MFHSIVLISESTYVFDKDISENCNSAIILGKIKIAKLLFFRLLVHFHFLPPLFTFTFFQDDNRQAAIWSPCGTPSPLDSIFDQLLLSISHLNAMGFFTFTFTVCFSPQFNFHFLPKTGLSSHILGPLRYLPFVELAQLLKNGWFHFHFLSLTSICDFIFTFY